MSFTQGPDAAGPLVAQPPIPQLLRDLVHERTGIFFESERHDTMLDKLEPRARALGCQSYLDYYYILKYDEKGVEEWRRVMDAFSVPETYFWRETDQIRYLVEKVVPAWFKTQSAPFRIWSAACATGEEAYSIAIALREAGWENHPIEILATDASETALTKARAGFYRERSFRSLPLHLRQKYFTAQKEGWELNREIRDRVNFRWANLMQIEAQPELAGPMQAIFCRNVFIYFSPDSIKQVVAAFARRLVQNSSLFVGASESLLKLTRQFELQESSGAFVYVRNGS